MTLITLDGDVALVITLDGDVTLGITLDCDVITLNTGDYIGR